MKLLLAPHNDDEALFASYIILREKPLVIIVTDSYVQFNRGDGITKDQRIQESIKACQILGAKVEFLHLRDNQLTYEQLKTSFDNLRLKYWPERVYLPALQFGHDHHDLIGRVGREIWPTHLSYATYTKKNLTPAGDIEIRPTAEEIRLKNLALDCYETQLKINKPHFDAVRGRSEWLVN